ncbi:exodeoxyribonuclease VII large subunit, partial [Nocardioides massiliensis]
RLDREQRAVADLRSRPVLADPRAGLMERRQAVRDLRDRGRRALGVRLEARAADLEHQRARVRSLSPLATLQRGYAVVRTADGHLVGADAEPGTGVRIRVAGAELGATIDDVRLIEESTDE